MQRFTAVTKAFSVTEMDGAVNIEKKSTRHVQFEAILINKAAAYLWFIN
jgi:hypothetical protein